MAWDKEVEDTPYLFKKVPQALRHRLQSSLNILQGWIEGDPFLEGQMKVYN